MKKILLRLKELDQAIDCVNAQFSRGEISDDTKYLLFNRWTYEKYVIIYALKQLGLKVYVDTKGIYCVYS